MPFFPNGSDELADAAAEQARDHDCVVLAHHGCSTLGAGVGWPAPGAEPRGGGDDDLPLPAPSATRTPTFPPEAFADLHHA